MTCVFLVVLIFLDQEYSSLWVFLSSFFFEFGSAHRDLLIFSLKLVNIWFKMRQSKAIWKKNLDLGFWTKSAQNEFFQVLWKIGEIFLSFCIKLLHCWFLFFFFAESHSNKGNLNYLMQPFKMGAIFFRNFMIIDYACNFSGCLVQVMAKLTEMTKRQQTEHDMSFLI